MLYHIFSAFREYSGFFNLFHYLTFRSMLGFFMSFGMVLVMQPFFIRWVRAKQFGQVIRDDGPESHKTKAGTPTMGGLVLVIAIMLTTFLLADLLNLYVWGILLLTGSYSALGFLDDYRKIQGKNSKGISAKQKLYWQLGTAFILVLLLLAFAPKFTTELNVPFMKDTRIDLGWLFVPFAMCVIVGASNAVNLTDGLDGLVIGPIMTTAVTYGIFAYVAGTERAADYLKVPYLAGTADLSIFAAAMLAAGLGFLWFNSFPAQVFMGDVGSLSLGGALGLLAVMTKQELALVIAGGVFVVEALSVILQVGSYKLRKKRIFKMAPIHHHFELMGIAEPKIIVRCWIISIVLAVVALLTLKLR